MSAKATFWAWHQDIKPATAKLVLLCLADCHNGDSGQCNPSISYLAKQTGLDPKTVRSGLAMLEKIGVVDAEKRMGASAQYHLQTPTNIGTPTPTENGTTKNGTPTENGTTNFGPNPYQKRQGTPTKNGTRTYKEPKKNLTTVKIPKSGKPFESELREFIKHRRNIKKPLTDEALSRFVNTVIRVADDVGITPGEVITETIDAGWQSVKAPWLKKRLAGNGPPSSEEVIR